MKKLLIALVVAGMMGGAVYGAANTMTVGFSTLATGTGDVAKCGDAEGITWVLDGKTVTGEPAVLGGTLGDITQADGVNIETTDDGACVGTELFVQAIDDLGEPILGAAGSCEVTAEGGLGSNEVDTSDNENGCTVTFSTPDISVVDIVKYIVTMT